MWHGANWTFVVWGGVFGAYVVIGKVWDKYVHKPEYKTVLSRIIGTAFCFSLLVFASIFFRANTLADAFTVIEKIVTDHGPLIVDKVVFVYGLTALAILTFKDTKDEFKWNVHFMHSKHIVVRYLSTILLIAYIILFGAFNGGQFIYFQF